MSSFIHADQNKRNSSIKDMVTYLWPYVWKYRLLTATFFLSVLVYILGARTLPWIFGHAVDEGLVNRKPEIIFSLAMMYLGCDVLRTLALFSHRYNGQRLGNRVLKDIRAKVLGHTQRLPMSYFDRHPLGRIMSRLTNDVVGLKQFFDQSLSSIFVGTIELISLVITMFLVSWKLAIAVLIPIPLVVFLAYKISSRLRGLFAESKKKMAEINAYTAERINGVRVVQLFSQQKRSKRHFGKLSGQFRELQIGTVHNYAMLWPLMSFSGLFNLFVVIMLAYLASPFLGMTTGSLSTFLLLTRTLFDPIRLLLEHYNEFQNSLASTDRILTLLEEPAEKQVDVLPVDAGTDLLHGRIEIRNLSFKYAPQTPYALKNVSFTVEPGQSVALIGRTGSGKTTLVSLLQKLYSYEEGQILIDGRPLNEIHTGWLRSKMGIVLQDNYIFRGTLYSNVTLNDESIAEADVIRALQTVQLGRLIRSSPLGIHKTIEEKGTNLSAGERQLLAFARILVFNPRFLILDEATSNLDSISELAIQRATSLVMKGRTCLIIAHRLSTVKDCDRVLVLSDGELISDEKLQGQDLEQLISEVGEKTDPNIGTVNANNPANSPNSPV